MCILSENCQEKVCILNKLGFWDMPMFIKMYSWNPTMYQNWSDVSEYASWGIGFYVVFVDINPTKVSDKNASS